MTTINTVFYVLARRGEWGETPIHEKAQNELKACCFESGVLSLQVQNLAQCLTNRGAWGSDLVWKRARLELEALEAAREEWVSALREVGYDRV